MESSRRVKSGKNFYIDLDQSSDYVFKEGDIVTGKCCLLSPLDEDVGSITISFHGTIKVRMVVSEQPKLGSAQGVSQNNYNSEDVLFSETKLLYQGPYTLRKHVLYEWPFQFQFPSGSLPPSGTFGKGPWNSAVVTYELEACRGRTSQEAASLEKRITPVNKDRNASTMSRTMFERIGSFTGMVAITPLQVSPPKGFLRGRTSTSFKVVRRFPVRSSQPSGSHHHGISGIFHHGAPDVEGSIVLTLPPSLIHGTTWPFLLNIETSTEIAQVSLESIQVDLKVFKSVTSKLGVHRKTDESTLTLFNQSKIYISIPTDSILDLGKTLNLRLDPTIIPTFSHARVELRYDLQVRLSFACGGQRFKEEFSAPDVQVISNRNPNSPLHCNHLCVFLPGNRQSDSPPPLYPGIEEKEDPKITSAYICFLQLLTQNLIPHSPFSSQTGDPAVMLHGRPQLPDAPPLSSQPSTNPFNRNAREDALHGDQLLLGRILDEEHGYTESNMRTGSDVLERFAYSWHSPFIHLSPRMRINPGSFVNVEITPFDADAKSKNEPPPYDDAERKGAEPLSPIRLFNNSLRLLASLQQPDARMLSDIEYVVNEFARELRSKLDEVDFNAAKAAVGKLEKLRGLLIYLGIDIDSGIARGKEKPKKKG